MYLTPNKILINYSSEIGRYKLMLNSPIPKYLFLWLGLLSFPIFGQSDSTAVDFRFTLSECIDYAIKNNLTVRQSSWDVVQSEVALKQSKADLLPSVNAGTNLSYNVGRTINEFTNEYIEAPVQQQNMNLVGQVTLFEGLRRLKTIRRNQSDVLVNELGLEATKNDITLEVVGAYTQILLSQELLETANFQQLTTEGQLNRTRRLVEAGSLPKADALQQEALLAQNETSVVDAENNLALAQLRLKQLLQIPAEQSLTIVDPEVDAPEADRLPASAEGVYEAAAGRLPAIRGADQQITSAEYGIAVAQAGYYPSITLAGGLSSLYSDAAPAFIPRSGAATVTERVPIGFLETPVPLGDLAAGTQLPVFRETQITPPEEIVENTYFNQLDFNLRRFVQLSLNIPIFNNWQVRSNVANAKIGLEQAQINALNQRNIVRQNIEQAYLDARAAAKSFAATRRQVAALQEAFKNTEVRYQAGAIDAVDYNQARNDLNGAESDLVRTKYNYVFSLKVLDFYQGKPLDF